MRKILPERRDTGCYRYASNTHGHVVRGETNPEVYAFNKRVKISSMKPEI